jgi:pilus assembly protein CpaE
MMPLTAAFLVSNRNLWEQAHACIQNLPVRLAIEQAAGESDTAEADALLDRIERHRVDVVLLEASRLSLPLEEFIRRVRSTAAQPAVFVLSPDASPGLILEALRAGANEYLYPPLGETLREALERLSATRSRGGASTGNALGRMFGFLSARGGCGATTFAVHVATDLARQLSARQIKEPILLADFDFDAGLLRFLMKSKNTYSVRDAIDNLRRMDSSLWKGIVSTHADKLDVIPAPEEIAARRAPEREETVHLMRFIRSMYPVSIADFGRSISVAGLDALPELEFLYLVTTPDAASIESARRAIQMVEERGFPSHRLKLLLNRAGSKTDRAGIEKVLGRPCEAIFRNDHMALYDAYSEGQFLSPANPLGKELHALTGSIRARLDGDREKAEKPVEATAGGRRWLSFLQKAPGFLKSQGQRAQA